MQEKLEKAKFAKEYFIKITALPQREMDLLLDYIKQDCGGVGPSVCSTITIHVDAAIEFCCREDLGTLRPGLDAITIKGILEVVKKAGIDKIEYDNSFRRYGVLSSNMRVTFPTEVYIEQNWIREDWKILNTIISGIELGNNSPQPL